MINGMGKRLREHLAHRIRGRASLRSPLTNLFWREYLAHLIRRYGLVRAGADPGLRLLSQAGGLEPRHNPGDSPAPAGAALPAACQYLLQYADEGALLSGLPRLAAAKEAAENLAKHPAHKTVPYPFGAFKIGTIVIASQPCATALVATDRQKGPTGTNPAIGMPRLKRRGLKSTRDRIGRRL
jgi:hypothetical protein